MNKKDRVNFVLSFFSKKMPDAKTELKYNNPFELTVAVILSAQCTDKRVNIITQALFKSFPTAQLMSQATIDDIFKLIKSCSYPRNKSKYLLEMSKMICNDFNNRIPDNLEDLQKLPGVGRKTANVIASVCYNTPAMPVDTHVFRVSNRIGLTTNATTPLQTELQLLRLIPKDKLNIAHHWLILHGRYTCKSRNPSCNTCGISNYCMYYSKI
tara:strand:+ start:245 stop:880 length:636 start_codon:yes stop_codon:yes gene_type:complete